MNHRARIAETLRGGVWLGVALGSVLLATAGVRAEGPSTRPTAEETAAESSVPSTDDQPALGEADSAGAQGSGGEGVGEGNAASADAEAGAGSAVEDPESPAEGVDESSEIEVDLGEWNRRVDQLIASHARGESTRAAANALYRELTEILWPLRVEVNEDLRTEASRALERREELIDLYLARQRVLAFAGSGLRQEMTGWGTSAFEELRYEIAYIWLNIRFQLLAIPRGLQRLRSELAETPTEVIAVFLELCFGLLVLRGWRRWAAAGLKAVRTRLLAIRPRQRIYVSTSRFLWYLDRVRGPLEWMVLLVYVSALTDPQEFNEVADLLAMVFWWLLWAIFAVQLIHAIGVRSSHRQGDEGTALQLRTLRILAVWILSIGLGLDLVDRYAGQGVLYAWARDLTLVAAVPLGILLILWWRPTILERLTEESDLSGWTPRLGRRGRLGFVSTILGALYLMGLRVYRLVLRQMSRLEVTRRLVTILLRREAGRDSESEEATASAVPPELVEKLLHSDSDRLASIRSKELQEVVKTVTGDAGGLAGIVGERGSGKSTLIRRVADELGDAMLVVGCPPGGWKPLSYALAEAVGIDDPELLPEQFGPRLTELGVKVMAIDDFHRLPRPRLGGQAGVDQIEWISSKVSNDVFWLLSMNRSSWLYTTLARGHRAIFQDVVNLDPLSDEQIGKLIDSRIRAAGIEPDYASLVLSRQLDDGESRTLEERNRLALHRILWELSEGNAEVAIRLFADSLRVLPNGRIVLRPPQLPPATEVAEANLSMLFTLRILAQCDVATLDDVVESLPVSRATIASALRFGLQRGWVEQADGFYWLSWRWYRTITRLLRRQNLLPRAS